MSYFDRIVSLVIVGLIMAVVAIIWRGDQVGVPIAGIYPSPNSTNAATTAQISVVFDRTMSQEQLPAFTISPPITGTAHWRGNSVVFLPAQPLPPNTRYDVTVDAGIPSQTGQILQKPLNWQFQTGQPTILFISWKEDYVNQLIIITLAIMTPPFS